MNDLHTAIHNVIVSHIPEVRGVGKLTKALVEAVEGTITCERNRALDDASKCIDDLGIDPVDLTTIGACLRDNRISAAIQALKKTHVRAEG